MLRFKDSFNVPARLRFLFYLVTSLLVAGNIQAQRFLERKGYDPKSVNIGAAGQMTMDRVFATLDKSNQKLAVSVTNVESNAKGESKIMAYASVLDLSTGRLERSIDKGSLYLLDNKLFLNDISAISGKWTSSKNFVSILTNSYYLFDSNSDQPHKITFPQGQSLIDVQNGYLLTTDANLLKPKSSIVELQGKELRVKSEFPVFAVKLTNDGKYAIGLGQSQGTGGFDQNSKAKLLNQFVLKHAINIYDINDNSTLINSITMPERPMLFHYLRNKKILYSTLNDVFLLDESGKQKELTFSDAGHLFQVNDDETEMISVSKKTGDITLWEISTGKVLAKIRDTFLPEKDNTMGYEKLFTSIPYKISGGEYYLIPYSTGIMSLVSSKDRKVIANLFFDNKDWAIIAHDGRYDGTPGAFDKLEWREYEKGEIVRQSTISTSFDKYFTPRLLYLLLHPESSVPVSSEVSLFRNIPVLSAFKLNDSRLQSATDSIPTATSKQKNITLDFKVTDEAERVKEVKFYHNNKLIAVLPRNETGIYQFAASLNSVNGEENYLYAIASTDDGFESEKTKVIVNYPATESSKPKLYALIVGINNYQNPKYTLNYALTDAKSVTQQIGMSKNSLFESIQIKTLFDKEATKEGIMNVFKELSSTITEKDIFLFYYAGHGTMNESNATQEFYIVPYDVTQLYGNETLLQQKAISAGEIKNLSMKISAQKQIFIIDACHSAGALTSAATRGAAEERAIGQLARSTGTFWITAAGTDQFATEFEQLGHGVFTYSLLEALQGKDISSSADGTITVRELSAYVEQRVPEISEKYKGNPQYPSSFSFGNDFPLILLR